MAKDSENNILRQVLITRFSALGDVAMTVPIVYPMCEANPKVNFVFATRKMAEGMFVNRPANLIVLGIDLDQYTGIFGPMKLALNLQHRYNFDAVADLHDVLRTKLMTFALKRKGVTIATIDKGRKEKRRLTHGKSKQPVLSTHARYRDVFRQLGLNLGEEFNSFRLGESHEKGINVLLDGSLLQQGGKGMCRFHQSWVVQVCPHNDATGIEIVVQGTALSKKFG